MKRFDPKKLTIHKGYLRFGRQPCHRLIWIEDMGPIPAGYEIHHKDGNTLNNLLSNLECLSKSDHARLHRLQKREEYSDRMKKNSVKIHAWLKTEEGKAFLSEKAKKQFANREEKEYTCEICKQAFRSKHVKEVKYCSDNCVMRARRLRGEDMEERSCVMCATPFRINRYQKTKTCSFACRNALISKLKSK